MRETVFLWPELCQSMETGRCVVIGQLVGRCLGSGDQWMRDAARC